MHYTIGQWQWQNFQKRWKLVLNIVTVLALGAVVYASRHDVLATIDNLDRLTPGAAANDSIPALNYHAQTRMYQDMFGVVGTSWVQRFG